MKDDIKAALCWWVAALVLAIAVLLPSCSALESACTKALPAMHQSSALVADAQLALDQARAYCSDLGPERASKCAGYVADAEAALHVAAQTLVVASSACEARDVGDVFRTFAAAWELLRPFLTLLGGEGGQAVADPIVVGMVR